MREIPTQRPHHAAHTAAAQPLPASLGPVLSLRAPGPQFLRPLEITGADTPFPVSDT
ncbi:hypothetical protein [Streptomyces vinaceus]|uniref:hypothetical protein n=1 Tax=Streptomyces vinaceus TaxID=1960 RepID=UPI0035E096C1